jgi:hypothetical protein
MTTRHSIEPMTEAEVTAFAAKTQAWWNQLTPQEQALFRQAVHAATAGTGNDDVQGYGDLEYAAYQLFFQGNALPALALAMNAFLSQPAPAATPPAPGGSVGGSSRRPTAMN